ncbi:MAG: precorrin-2 C(20)-methyltransferase [Oscillospiraceae bacterium]
MELKQGIFYGVSVGPGDPELLTLQAVRVLDGCAVIAVPQTKSGETLALDIARQAVDLTGKTILPLAFTMARDEATRDAAHRAALAVLAPYLAAGQDVALLNLGDVSLYSTYGYLMALAQEAGYETVMLPGVPSFCAVAARLGIPLTRGNQPLHILPAGGDDLTAQLSLSGTKVLMKAGGHMETLLAALEETGQRAQASMVENCGLPSEVVSHRLTAGDTGYFATIVVREERT